jgi:hypothetical protein
MIRSPIPMASTVRARGSGSAGGVQVGRGLDVDRPVDDDLGVDEQIVAGQRPAAVLGRGAPALGGRQQHAAHDGPRPEARAELARREEDGGPVSTLRA